MKKYVFKPYNLIFPTLFKKEKERISTYVNHRLIIEHIGSTAVPGLGGKGIIDIAVAVNKEDMGLVSKQLQALGYEFRPTFSTQDRLYFIAYLPDSEEGNRRYHIHLTYLDNQEWRAFLGFRDYLLSHPKALQEYTELKKEAANVANGEGETYRNLKEPFYNKINSEITDAVIREMKQEDFDQLIENFCFPWSSLETTSVKWTHYYNEHQKQIRTVYVLEKEKEIIGYASLLHISAYPHFKNADIPEINDVWIAEKWRKKGFGKMLVQHIENTAYIEGYQQIGIGVGLYADYANAQKLYIRLGYVPDGYGVSYKYQPTVPGDSYPLDDELILWLKKEFKKAET